MTEERIERAKELRKKGYNCAQTVLMVFDDVTGLDEPAAARLAAGFGAGVACGEICGVMSAIALIEGLIAEGNPPDKRIVYGKVKALADEFRARHGALRCAELKGGPKIVPCNELIFNGITMLSESLGK